MKGVKKTATQVSAVPFAAYKRIVSGDMPMRFKRFFGEVFVAIALLASSAMSAAGQGFLLVTPEEYARDQASKIHYKALAISEPGAPKIEIIEPLQKDTIRVPIKIHIRFNPANDARIVVDTVRILYGWLGIDITERIRRHAVINSMGIKADNAELPEGSHRITIRVADTKDRQAETTFRIRVIRTPSN
jgi:hypothetical protein